MAKISGSTRKTYVKPSTTVRKAKVSDRVSRFEAEHPTYGKFPQTTSSFLDQGWMHRLTYGDDYNHVTIRADSNGFTMNWTGYFGGLNGRGQGRDKRGIVTLNANKQEALRELKKYTGITK